MGLMERLGGVALVAPDVDAHAVGVGVDPARGHANQDSQHDAGVGPVMRAGAAASALAPSSQLDPVSREGLGRPQTHRISMGISEEYADGPRLDGRHNVIVNRPAVVGPVGVTMLPWERPAPTSYRTVPPNDSGNPPPSNCG